MSTGIEWTDETWNPVAGCSIVSPGCKRCYAMKMAARIERMIPKAKHYRGLTRSTKAGPVWTGKVTVAPEHTLLQPLRWRRPRRIFVNSMSDLFHEDVSDETIDKVFAVMALCPQHTFQILTKRAKRMRAWFEERWQPALAHRYDLKSFGCGVLDVPAQTEGDDPEARVDEVLDGLVVTAGLADPDNDAHWDEDGSCKARKFTWPLPNVWLGVSTEDQERADERVHELVNTPAAKRFISAEPLLGPVMLGAVMDSSGDSYFDALYNGIDWVIVGGESGPGSRPMHPDWARRLRDECAGHGVPFFFKQWGEWAPDPSQMHVRGDYVGRVPGEKPQTCADACFMAPFGKKGAVPVLDGVTHRAFPT